MSQVLVTGAAGCLGKEVVRFAKRQFDVIIADYTLLDITNRQAVDAMFHKHSIEAVINCAGIVKNRSIAPSQYIAVNSIGPHILAETASKYNARLLHVSTDCVFSGKCPPYSECSTPDPLDTYGRSKLAGEVYEKPHLTVRTSFIGLGDRGLLAWMLAQKEQIPGYSQAVWNGITAPLFARILVELIKKTYLTGLLHVAGNTINKYDLLKICASEFELETPVVEVETPEDYKVNRTLISVRNQHLLIPPVQAMVHELAVRYKNLNA